MIFNRHSNLEGKHAFLGASKYHWLKDDKDQIIKRLCGQYASEMGTILHDIARKHIKHSMKMGRYEKKSIILELLERGIPDIVINTVDFDSIYHNLVAYVNDCISFRMKPEVVLYYSDICFGTADAISYREKERLLRISDYKSGSTIAHMEQLLIYAALFCLEYKIKPYELTIELRIYQSNDIIFLNATAEDIVPIMDKIVSVNNFLLNIQNEEE